MSDIVEETRKLLADLDSPTPSFRCLAEYRLGRECVSLLAKLADEVERLRAELEAEREDRQQMAWERSERD